MIVLFVGWFKIEGHSNPQNRKYFKHIQQAETDRKRTRSTHHTGDNLLRQRILFRLAAKRRKKIIQLSFSVLVVIAAILGYLQHSQPLASSKVIDHMSSLHYRTTGSEEFISTSESHKRSALELIEAHKYGQARTALMAAFKLGSNDPEIYQLLVVCAEELCEGDDSYGLEIEEWEKVYHRLTN